MEFSQKAIDTLDTAGKHSLPKRRIIKSLMAIVGAVAATVTLIRAIADVGRSTKPWWSSVPEWAASEFTLTSSILILAFFSLFMLTWKLKRVNLRDIKELLEEREERDDEQSRAVSLYNKRIGRLQDELSRIKDESEAGRTATWNDMLKFFLAVHGTTRHTYFKSIHDLPKRRRIQETDQNLVAENVCRTVLAEIERIFSIHLGFGSVLCCAKLLRDSGFHCMYPVTYEDDQLLETHYSRADRSESLPGHILDSGRECYYPRLTDAPFEPSVSETALLRQFNITGFAACPMRVHEEFNQAPIPIGVFFVFMRNDSIPADEQLFRMLTRLFTEHLADMLQFTRSITRFPTARSRDVNETHASKDDQV